MRNYLLSLKLFFVFSFLFCSSQAFCQDLNTNIAINQLLVDEDNVWFTTDEGLGKLDKATEEISWYTKDNNLPDNNTQCLAKDREGNLWVTHFFRGLTKFDGENFINYNSSNSGLLLHIGCYKIIIDEEDNKWVGTNWYVNKFDGENWENWSTLYFLPVNLPLIYALKFDSNGTLWMGTNGVDAFSKIESIETEDYEGIPIIKPSNQEIYWDIERPVISIEEDNYNNIWLVTRDKLLKYDKEKFTTYDETNTPELTSIIDEVKKDNNGDLWIASGNHLVKYDGLQFQKYELPVADGLITTIDFDEENESIWLGTKNNGIYKFEQSIFTQFEINQTPVSIHQTIENGSVLIYPNPVSDFFTIQLPEAQEIQKVEVMDSAGKIIFTGTLKEENNNSYHASLKDMRISDNGIYFVRIITKDRNYIHKIIVNHTI